MVNRFYGYQYDTNPRKLSPENTQIRNRYSRNGEQNAKKQEATVSSARKRKTFIQDDEDETYLFERKNNKKLATEIEESIGNKKKNSNDEYKKNNINESVKPAKKTKNNIKPKLKVIIFLIAGFSVLFAVSYQNSLINESFNKKEQYKKEAEALSKTNQQMAVNIENNLNLNNVEQVAKDRLGMQKLNNNQKVYVNLPKVDYVAPAAEQIIIEEDTNIFTKIINGVSKAFK